MSSLLAEINQVAATGLAALLNTLWYAGVVVALAWIGLRYCPRVNAATRYWIWTAVLGFLLVLPFLPGLMAHARTLLAAREEAAAVAPLATVPAPTPPASMRHVAPVTLAVNTVPGSNPWALWLLAAWVVAAGWQLARLLMSVVSVRRLKHQATCLGSGDGSGCSAAFVFERCGFSVQLQATGLKSELCATKDALGCSAIPGAGALSLRLRRPARLLTSAEVDSPVAVGYLHPAIIVPPKLLECLKEGERQDVLLHETAHLARCDDWMALATQALSALLILHPLVAIVLKRIEREREMACDDFVVACTGSARSYARSLARLHDLRWSTGTRLLAPGILGRTFSLGDRIESLLRRGREFSTRPSAASLGVSALLLALLLGAGGLMPDWVAIAQTALPKSFYAGLPKSFEAASVRPAKPGSGTDWDSSNGRLWATVPIRVLIRQAYQIMPQQLEGLPSWARSARYTIQAEAPPVMARDYALARKLPPEQGMQALVALRRSWRQMLQSLLGDRFKLKAHRETKLLPVYELMVAKGGPKLKPSSVKPGGMSDHGWHGHLVEVGASMEYFASGLSQWEPQGELGRIVIDKTGLAGRYDFTLTWTPWRTGTGRTAGGGGIGGAKQPAMQMASSLDSSASSASSGPSIFTAIQQQLGLRLKPAKGPVEVLVIDHLEQPSAN
jgi:bla regulator protein blaR1